MRSLIFIFTVIALFIGCTKIPEKTDIKEILNKIEEERAAKCGDGIRDDWEECDFEGTKSCSAYDSGNIGPAKCQNCKLDLSECKIKEICDAEFCNSNGTCKEIRYLDEIFCDCVEGYSGKNCDECDKSFHLDFDQKCISDQTCTLIGCKLKNEECYIDDGMAKCKCKHPWTGEECDECIDGFFIKDDLCITDNCSLMKCFDYEKCDNSSGLAICACVSENQVPEDCSKCLPGYYWDDSSSEKCINEKIVACRVPINLPENAVVISSKHKIYYSDDNGWDTIPVCEWKCKSNYIKIDVSCKNPLINKFTLNLAPLGFDEKDSLIAIDDHGIYSISKDQIETIKTLSIKFYEGVIGNDRNYYLNSLYGFGIFFTAKNDFIYIRTNSYNKNSYNMSILKNYISFGNSYLDFPELKLIKEDRVDASNISDKDGNILTVYSDGTIFFSNESWNTIWSTNFQNYFLGRSPVIRSDNIAYIPCCNRNSQKPGVLKINLLNPDENEEIVVESEYNCYEETPTIILGENGKKYVLYGLFIQIYDKNDKLISDTSKISINKVLSNLAPVTTDNGILYFQSVDEVYCINEDGELLWRKALDSFGGEMIHNKGILYVFGFPRLYLFYAPGNISGDWPQMKHDARLSNSLLENKFVDPPSAPVALSPEDNAVFNTNSVTFLWAIDSSDPNIKYTLLLRNSGGYDKVYAGPEIGLSTVTVNDLSSGNYEWRVVSKDENGSLNVSDARTFTVE